MVMGQNRVRACMGWNCGAGVQRWRGWGYLQLCLSVADSLNGAGGGGGFELHGVAHALSSEPFSLVRGATAIISPLGLTSTSVVAMLALLVGAIGTESCLRSP